MCPKPQETADLATLTEEILNKKTSFFVQCTLISRVQPKFAKVIHGPFAIKTVVENLRRTDSEKILAKFVKIFKIYPLSFRKLEES